uniref:J domain-containing protein n=1 Tax=Octactis speculum TaxID=3111310 RepID=A0A7S2GM86_9STRA|mmetsp:Transcript_50218/g.68307  ORF Transcript_50218/g.68307 Transcript_50218/m.68307 type:complete len:425 (+) Transcript_50218:184-1458(+)
MEAVGEASLQALTEFRAAPYLEVLGLDMSATLKEIKKKYRKLALKMHPDKGGDPDTFLKLTEAYEMMTTLKDVMGDGAMMMDHDTVVNEIEVQIQRSPGDLGFGVTLFRDEEENGVTYVKRVAGLTEIQGSVKVGDILVRVDGVPIKGISFPEVMNKFKVVPTGNVVTLRLLRTEDSGIARDSDVQEMEGNGSTEAVDVISTRELGKVMDCLKIGDAESVRDLPYGITQNPAVIREEDATVGAEKITGDQVSCSKTGGAEAVDEPDEEIISNRRLSMPSVLLDREEDEETDGNIVEPSPQKRKSSVLDLDLMYTDFVNEKEPITSSSLLDEDIQWLKSELVRIKDDIKGHNAHRLKSELAEVRTELKELKQHVLAEHKTGGGGVSLGGYSLAKVFFVAATAQLMVTVMLSTWRPSWLQSCFSNS